MHVSVVDLGFAKRVGLYGVVCMYVYPSIYACVYINIFMKFIAISTALHFSNEDITDDYTCVSIAGIYHNLCYYCLQCNT